MLILGLLVCFAGYLKADPLAPRQRAQLVCSAVCCVLPRWRSAAFGARLIRGPEQHAGELAIHGMWLNVLRTMTGSELCPAEPAQSQQKRNGRPYSEHRQAADLSCEGRAFQNRGTQRVIERS